MLAQEIIETLRERGATVRALAGDQIEVAPRRVLDDELREAIRSHKPDLLAELNKDEGTGDILGSDPILETREQLGAVRLRSRRFGCEFWIALAPGMADELRSEESQRSNPRPVLLPEDVASLRGRPPEAVEAVLRVAAAFPGARVIQ